MFVETSSERVADFLLSMADRSPATDADWFPPMSRQEFSNHLSLTFWKLITEFFKI